MILVETGKPRNKTMNDKLMNIFNYPLCWLNLYVEKFKHLRQSISNKDLRPLEFFFIKLKGPVKFTVQCPLPPKLFYI